MKWFASQIIKGHHRYQDHELDQQPNGNNNDLAFRNRFHFDFFYGRIDKPRAIP